MPGLMHAVERLGFEASLYSPFFFEKVARPLLYRRNGGDFGEVHEDALQALNEHAGALVRQADRFDFPHLGIALGGKVVQPFGTAAGMDKDCKALGPLSYVFGFQEPGTVVVPVRDGNPSPREAADPGRGDLYNAQGFPSEGIEASLERLRAYRESEFPQKPLYVSVTGIPSEGEPGQALEVARGEMEQLLRELGPHADGFVWNPFSPNTATMTALREPDIFREYGELMARLAPGKLLLVKMGPYETEGRGEHLALVEAFLDGGGHGVVGPNTKMVPKSEVPSDTWGYPSAGKSGTFLQPYRQRLVTDTRQVFPQAVILATGGISDGEQAYDAFKAGATGVEGYTPYTFRGLGLARQIMRGVEDGLETYGHTLDGYPSLAVLQDEVRGGRELLGPKN